LHSLAVSSLYLVIELAGELRESLPHVKLNLIHRGRALMNDAYPDKYRNALHEMLSKAGVNVILNDSIVDETPNEEGVFITDGGQPIAADLIVSWPYTVMLLQSLRGCHLADSGAWRKTKQYVVIHTPLAHGP
jgi:hypothetical protein